MLPDAETPTDERTEEQDDANLALLLAGALVDHFEPRDFGKNLVAEALHDNALAHLSGFCEEVRHGASYRWSLKSDIRREALKQHWESALFSSVRSSTKPEPGDVFGRFLGMGLDREDLTRETESAMSSPETAHALMRASTLIEFLGIEPAEPLAGTASTAPEEAISRTRSIRQRIAQTASINALNNTAGGDLYGRYHEFRELIKYRNTDLSEQVNGPLKLFIVIGVGGIGKSALVSRYVAWQRERTGQPPVIYLDFDRPSLKPDDPLALTLEFTRQLGMFETSLDAALSRFRKVQREHNPGMTSHRMSGRALFAALSDLRAVLAYWPGRNRAVTVVIDTFEEVALQGKLAVNQTVSWLSDLRNTTGLDNLHIIISGREMPDALLADHDTHVCHRARLTDLHRDSAILLIRNAGIDEVTARQAVDVFGGNPLVLRMFICFRETKPDGIQALLEDGRQQKRSAPTGQLAVQFLYERILVRISDERVRKLTNPGLLLRHVTADLIRRVLAEPCGLGAMSDEQAEELFETMAGHVWLVRQEGDRLLSHRRDLRRLMLPGIQQQDPAVYDDIIRRAIAYYESSPEGVSPHDAWLEAAYHRGFLPEKPVYTDPDEARQIISRLGADLLDWPVHASALIKHAAQLPERLTEDEIDSLSRRQGITSRAIRAEQLLDADHVQAASDEWARGEDVQDPPVHERRVSAPHALGEATSDRYEEALAYRNRMAVNAVAMRLAFHQGRFERLSERASEILDPLFSRRDALATTHFWQDERLVHKLPWYVALSVLAEPVTGMDAENIIPVRALDAVQATPRRVGIKTTFELFYMLAIASLMEDSRAVQSLNAFLRASLPHFSPPIDNAAQIQVLQLCVQATTAGALIGNSDLITVTNCDALRFESLQMPISATHPDTRANRQRLAVARQADEAVSRRRPSLKELDEIRACMRQHKVEVLGPHGLCLLQSRQEVLYRPIQFALATVSVDEMESVLWELSRQSVYWPTELTPGDTPRRRHHGRAEITALVETADRCGLLGTALELSARTSPDPLLKDELRLLQRLEAKLHPESLTR